MTRLRQLIDVVQKQCAPAASSNHPGAPVLQPGTVRGAYPSSWFHADAALANEQDRRLPLREASEGGADPPHLR